MSVLLSTGSGARGVRAVDHGCRRAAVGVRHSEDRVMRCAIGYHVDLARKPREAYSLIDLR